MLLNYLESFENWTFYPIFECNDYKLGNTELESQKCVNFKEQSKKQIQSKLVYNAGKSERQMDHVSDIIKVWWACYTFAETLKVKKSISPVRTKDNLYR